MSEMGASLDTNTLIPRGIGGGCKHETFPNTQVQESQVIIMRVVQLPR